MPDYATQGAVSGAGSGAASGFQVAGPWGALAGGVLGGAMGAMGGMAGDKAAARAKRLADLRRSAQKHATQLELQASQQAQDRLRQLAAQRYASYGQLSQQLGGPERTAAGQQAGVDFQSRLGAAMGGVDAAPVGNRALVGGAASSVPINAQLDPLTAARQAALQQGRIQGGLQRFDTGAFNEQQATNIGLNRQAQETMQQQNALAQIRQRMLAQDQAQFGNKGPTSGENRMMAMSGLGRLGLDALGSYAGVSRQNALADAARQKAAVPTVPFDPNADYSGANNPFGYNPPSYTYRVS